jgi:serine/threonine protein kinase
MTILPSDSPPPPIENQPPPPGSSEAAPDILVARLAAEMNQRWRQGERPLVEEFLARHPVLKDHPEAALELIYEELSLRQEHGQEMSPLDLAQRFPQWGQPLQILIACQHLLRPAPAASEFPSAGETLGDFHLITELGRGAQGRVFLATQSALAGRPVVVKFIPRDGQEHLSLARLQHTHIVPLYSVHDFPERGLLSLCMPYFGGTTLARLLQGVRHLPPPERSGKQLLNLLQEVQAAAPVPVPEGAPAYAFLARASYVQAICWMGACLADALHYASERGLVHLDVKPANVLLAADGQPMLLDFHLARPPLAAGTLAPDRLGGTPAYMAPEHQAVMPAIQVDGPVPVTVDGRADIFALGALLYEALGGPIPAAPARAQQELREANPQVTVGLADLLARCLAHDPRDRYAHAASLAADLRRHLTDLRLKGVRNRSLVERWHKWRRRRPSALALVGLLLTVLTAGALFLAHANRQLQLVRMALSEGRDDLANHHPGEARSAFQRGLALMEPISLSPDLKRELHDQLRAADFARAAEDLHLLVERLRPYFGTMALTPEEVRQVESHCRQFWENRSVIRRRLESATEPELNEQIQTDLLDLAILWTDLFVSHAGTREASARKEALTVLDQAEDLFGPSWVLDHERRTHAAVLGLPAPARTIERAPRTAWEHCALGRTFLRSGDLPAATEEFQRALDQEPNGLWSNFYSGTCAYRQKRFQDAVTSFAVCVALAPDRGWCYYNRGLALMELGRSKDAVKDFNTALRLDPTLAAALHRDRLQRGL